MPARLLTGISIFCFSTFFTFQSTFALRETPQISIVADQTFESEVHISSECEDIVMIADFNSGTSPNNIGGDWGAWVKDPSDQTQGCTADSFREPSGDYAIVLDYDVDSPQNAYNGFWMYVARTQNSGNPSFASPIIDFLGFDYLCFDVRGDPGKRFTPQIKVEFMDRFNTPSPYLLRGITSKWQTFKIPLSEFKLIRDRSSLWQFAIVFDDTNSFPRIGRVYIDNIRVGKR